MTIMCQKHSGKKNNIAQEEHTHSMARSWDQTAGIVPKVLKQVFLVAWLS